MQPSCVRLTLVDEKYFNREGWEYILNSHGGKLPVVIKAVEEGTVVPINNVLMTIENTDNKCFWLTNFLETILSQVWYPITVASLSREVKVNIKEYLDLTSDGGLLNFGLHDFGFRGPALGNLRVSGVLHLINFLGTDTVVAMEVAVNYYNADLNGLAFSVAATEHSVMTALGKNGEEKVVENLLNEYPTGILSVVSDSYDIYNFVSNIVGTKFKDRILAVMVYLWFVLTLSLLPILLQKRKWFGLWKICGRILAEPSIVRVTRLLIPSVRVLWGDGIDIEGIKKILYAVTKAGFATENIACFGMGGGLLQKVNRDTQRCAFKCSAQYRDGQWYDIQKNPKDVSKASKKGKLKLIKVDGEFETVGENDSGEDYLKVVFYNGVLVNEVDFATVRKNAAL
jgi:nicotinamide phosphoribosyltransferase